MNKQSVFLSSDRIGLRPLTKSDISQDYLSWLNDFEVTRYLEVGRFPQTAADVEKFLVRFQTSLNDLVFAIIDRETDLHIGNVTLNNVNMVHRSGDTGLMIGRKEFWGKGLAIEAWGLLIEYAFDRLGLRKIIAGVIDGNVASLKTLQKLGFQIEGTLRQEVLVSGEHQDVFRLGLFKDEYIDFRAGRTSQ